MNLMVKRKKTKGNEREKERERKREGGRVRAKSTQCQFIITQNYGSSLSIIWELNKNAKIYFIRYRYI